MKIPETVTVLGKTYRVFIGRNPTDGAWGRANHIALEIDLKKDLAPDQTQETFFHELLHAVANALLSDDISEAQATALSSGLFAVLRDNGWWPG